MCFFTISTSVVGVDGLEASRKIPSGDRTSYFIFLFLFIMISHHQIQILQHPLQRLTCNLMYNRIVD